jgi:hypothetical protein
MKQIIGLLMVFTTLSAIASTELTFVSSEDNCSAQLYTNEFGVSCLEITDTSNKEIIRDICVDSGLGHGPVELPVNIHTGYQVNQQFQREKGLFFTAWTGGGLNFMPQNYITLREVAGGFDTIKEVSWIYGEDEELCTGMSLTK